MRDVAESRTAIVSVEGSESPYLGVKRTVGRVQDAERRSSESLFGRGARGLWTPTTVAVTVCFLAFALSVLTVYATLDYSGFSPPPMQFRDCSDADLVRAR
jgi:hypothetical protein